MKKMILAFSLMLVVSVAHAAEKPWYVRFSEWFECTWLGANMIASECQKSNYLAKDLIGRKTFLCNHRVWHGPKN